MQPVAVMLNVLDQLVKRKEIGMSNSRWEAPVDQATPQQKGRLSAYLIIGAFVLVVLIVAGFGLGRLFSGNEESESQAGDGSDVVVPDGAGQDGHQPELEKSLTLTDHEALVSASKGNAIEGTDLNVSGDPTDLYFIASAPEGSEYSITTYSTDESGQRIENESMNITDPVAVLAPEETGLHIKEGVLLIDEQGAQNDCNRMFSVGQATSPSDPGCSYGVSYWRSGQPAEDDKVVLLAVDGTGKVIGNNEFWTSPQHFFAKNEGGKIVLREE